MLKEIFNHLKNTQCFIKYKEKVSEYNADALGLFLMSGFFICAVALLLQFILLRTPNFWPLVILVVYFAVCVILYRKFIHELVDHSAMLMYLAQIPVIAMVIVMGTMVNPDVKAFTFMPVMLSFPIFLLDKPRNIFLYILLIACAFILTVIRFKSGELLLHDILHCIVTALFSFAASVFVLNDRIDNVEKSQMFLTDSEHDPLTGIYNRRGGEEKIREFIHEHVSGTLIILDIDDFKHVNDTYGHTIGDIVLSAASMTLANSFRSSDIVMRMGGDEFVVYAPGLTNRFFLHEKLSQINVKMREITCSAGKDNITVSMGAVINDGSYPNYEAVFNEADRLLYETKKQGKDSFRLQDRPYSEETQNRDETKAAMRLRAEREAASEAEEAKFK